MDYAAAAGVDAPRDGPATSNAVENLLAVLLGLYRQQTGAIAVLDELAERAAGLRHLRRQVVHVEIAAVDHRHPRRAVEHADALRDVAERRLQDVGLLREAPGLAPQQSGREQNGQNEQSNQWQEYS